MGDLLVSVEKTFGGETWANTHCLRMNGAGGTVTDADMATLGVATAITAANTASGGAVNPLTRILSFERLCHQANITISRVYITDGKRNALQMPDYFWSATLSLPGLASSANQTGTYAPGTVAMIVNRIPTGYNSRSGRLFIRGLLYTGDITFNLRGGVSWNNQTQAGVVQGLVNTAISGSGIATMFNGAANAGAALYCIPHYESAKVAPTKTEIGQLVNATPVVNLIPSAPRGRQMLRGKKRKKAATGTVAV